MTLSVDEIEKRIADSYELPNNVLEKVPQPMVSIRTSTYNHGPYIRQCIEGVLMQKTNFSFEFIIGEDYSTDGTRDIVFEYAKRYPDVIRVITADYNVGTKANGRRCIRACRGKYMAICEGDDYWIDPLKLQKQVDFLEGHPDYVLSHTSIKYYYQSQHLFITSKDAAINSNILKKGFLSKEDILLSYRIQTASVLFRRILLDEIYKYDTFLYQSGYFLMGDTPLWYGLLGKGKIHFLPEVTTVYRKNNNSVTGHNNLKKYFRFILSMAELRLYLAKRDNLSTSFSIYAQKLYQNSAINYLAFDPSFKLLYPLDLEKIEWLKKKLYKISLLKYYLTFYIFIRSFLGNLRRKIIKSI
ncbi:glycosyltransferase family 2 protein [Bacteroides sp.]|uniref:glycosyltransferase family 2 protein n=1 Tax=Bacteroides sp. TaxID=29523 RepID=UPI00258F5289|nr:glycosyltransferase [Bacteroides sp.]